MPTPRYSLLRHLSLKHAHHFSHRRYSQSRMTVDKE